MFKRTLDDPASGLAHEPPASDRNAPTDTISGIVVGKVHGLLAGQVTVTHPASEGSGPTIARPLGPITDLAPGDDVALMFEGGDPAKPVLLGRMAALAPPPAAEPIEITGPVTIVTDTERTEISHPRKLSFRCGKAHITLSADGRIEINGEYLLSTAKGLNRIAGASVKIN